MKYTEMAMFNTTILTAIHVGKILYIEEIHDVVRRVCEAYKEEYGEELLFTKPVGGIYELAEEYLEEYISTEDFLDESNGPIYMVVGDHRSYSVIPNTDKELRQMIARIVLFY